MNVLMNFRRVFHILCVMSVDSQIGIFPDSTCGKQVHVS